VTATHENHPSNVDVTNDELSLIRELSSLPELGNAEEQRTFHFFRRFTGPRLAADLDSGFWTALVLKLCHSEPAVRHGVLAVSSYHESLVRGEQDNHEELAGKQVFALQQYNKAIALLREQISHDTVSEPLVPLLMCLLFVCMEYMQRKEVESLDYLQQGRKMMHQFVESRQIPSSQLDIIRRYIVPIYVRSCLTSFLFGANVLPVPEALNIFCEVPPRFSSMEEARNTFYSIADRLLRSAFIARQTKYNASTPPELAHALNTEQQAILSTLSKWNAAFSLLIISRPDGSPPQPSALVMQLYYYAALIWGSTSFTQNETDFDKHIDSFSAMLRLAKDFLDATDNKTSKSGPGRRSSPGTSGEKVKMPTSGLNENDLSDMASKVAFAFETHIIPPLYFISVKCRHPLIRRAALELLQKHDDRQENLWRSKCMGRVAARFIEIETNISLNARHGMATTLPFATPATLCRPPYPNTGRERRVPTSIRPSRANLSGYGVFSTHDHPVDTTDITFDWDLSDLDSDMSNIPPDTFFGGLTDQQSAPESSQPVDTTLSPSNLDESLLFSSPDVGFDCDTLQCPDYIVGLPYCRDHPRRARPLPSNAGSAMPPGAGGVDASSHLSLEAPYGLPEALRVADAIIGPLESDGRWTTFFRKPKTVGGKWEKWDEYIYTS
jgi:hypothetical protein